MIITQILVINNELQSSLQLCLYKSAHASGTKFKGGNFKHFKTSIGRAK